MSIRRRAAALGAVSLGLIALSACEKPTPVATITVGDKSVTTEATEGCFSDGGKLSEASFTKCLTAKPTHTLTVESGDKVRVGVDPSIAETGWLVATDASQKTDLLKDKTYWSLTSDGFFVDSQTGATSKEVVLNIIQAGDGSNAYRGFWKVKLVKG